MLEIGPYGTPFEQAPWNFLLDLFNKGARESNSHYINFISRKKELIMCPTAMRTPGKPCNLISNKKICNANCIPVRRFVAQMRRLRFLSCLNVLQ